jgi:ribonuclease HI
MPKPDPAKAKKLARFIDAWRSGSALEDAAKKAGIDEATARQFIDSIKQSLEDEAAGAQEAARPARPKRSRKPGGKLSVSAVCDGASRGNPGQAACAVIVYDADGDELLRRSRSLGVATNNVAEYHGVMLALELAEQLNAADVSLRLDSELVVRQLNGQYKVKNETLRPLFKQAQEQISHFERVEITHVRRTETTEADQLANDELDGNTESG